MNGELSRRELTIVIKPYRPEEDGGLLVDGTVAAPACMSWSCDKPVVATVFILRGGGCCTCADHVEEQARLLFELALTDTWPWGVDPRHPDAS